MRSEPDWTLKKPPDMSVQRSTEMLDHVDYKLAETYNEKEAIFRLRYQAYLREEAIQPRADERVTDDYDDATNSWIFGVYIEQNLLSSIRITVASPEFPNSPSIDVFPDVLAPHLAHGEIIVDPTRFVADPIQARRFPELPYLTLRLVYIACSHFNANIGLATVRAEHRAFYRRVFSYESLCEPRLFPGLTKPVGLMGMNFPIVREAIFERRPYLRSSHFERRMLFDRNSSNFVVAKRSLADAKAELGKLWEGDGALPLCMKILDYAMIAPTGDEEVLNFTVLSRVVGKNQPDSELLRALTILTSSKFSALSVRGKFIDDDGMEYSLSSSELSDACVSNRFIHPKSRRIVEEFDKKLMLFFAPSTLFEASRAVRPTS